MMVRVENRNEYDIRYQLRLRSKKYTREKNNNDKRNMTNAYKIRDMKKVPSSYIRLFAIQII